MAALLNGSDAMPDALGQKGHKSTASVCMHDAKFHVSLDGHA